MIRGICNGARVSAVPGANAACPSCGGDLVPKCGRIVAWHWAHKAKDCDAWSEGESAWHLGWKMLAPHERCEVVRGPHRADIVGLGGGVVELQHSAISVDEILERERFYGKMVWLFDASEFRKNLSLRARGDFISFRWRWPRKSLLAVTKPLFFDFGDGHLLEVRKLGEYVPLGGWGYHRSQQWFCKSFLGVDAGIETTLAEFHEWAGIAFCSGCKESWLATYLGAEPCPECASKLRRERASGLGA